ncbi:hypothetical protein [Sphingomonas sp. LHG3406-1]|uniref:hypothetical protein n=1 Tax=Sphingomonas sp. LHG3406-1 TaxID=2804617 RepID=UPI00263984E4|nr:hypothetical protein [Sphingomonas sp. LHG3406-1]
MAAALAPLRARMPRAVVEREILRVVATIPGADERDRLEDARQEVLRWAQRRMAERLPVEAWSGGTFETLAAGRTTMGSLLSVDGTTLWSLRADDPDKNVAGRIWSTEVSLGRTASSQEVQLGVRLVVNSAEPELVIEPAVPGLVRQIADTCGLRDGDVPVRNGFHWAEHAEHVETVTEWVLSDARRLPVIVATGDGRADDPHAPKFNLDGFANALVGLAHVVWIPANLTFGLSDALGKQLSVFHGGLRVYQPGLTIIDDPRDHQLFLGHVVEREPASVMAELRRGVARESLRRTRLGHDVLTFAAVRSAASESYSDTGSVPEAADDEKLKALLKQIEAMNNRVVELQAQVDQAWQLSEEESERAEASERQLFSSFARIEHLEHALIETGAKPQEVADPTSWEEFVGWCDTEFAGKVTLSPSARRGIRKAQFQDIEEVAQCIRWLASIARDRFMIGGGTLANIPVFEGITNAPCGNDEYTFDFQGRRLTATWHLKNGGNTRQPERCLRIYYSFDEQTRQIIVSDMPAHLRTGAS